jgi:hypothetical protein
MNEPFEWEQISAECFLLLINTWIVFRYIAIRRVNIKFNYSDKELKIVAHFSYLGIVFSKTGSFNIAKKELVNKGNNKITELRTILQRESPNS